MHPPLSLLKRSAAYNMDTRTVTLQAKRRLRQYITISALQYSSQHEGLND